MTVHKKQSGTESLHSLWPAGRQQRPVCWSKRTHALGRCPRFKAVVVYAFAHAYWRESKQSLDMNSLRFPLFGNSMAIIP